LRVYLLVVADSIDENQSQSIMFRWQRFLRSIWQLSRTSMNMNHLLYLALFYSLFSFSFSNGLIW
jgi:hypothetical protein